tara:strand:+ start:72 stop:191 length:120 start_codon:yes stop_codon:yes gene_type:complete
VVEVVVNLEQVQVVVEVEPEVIELLDVLHQVQQEVLQFQ